MCANLANCCSKSTGYAAGGLGAELSANDVGSAMGVAIWAKPYSNATKRLTPMMM